jgi:membrane-associated protease RseP (regulator of RpoE activity)
VNPGPAASEFTPAIPQRTARDRYWLHILLLLITLWSATAVGARMSYSFEQNRPAMLEDDLMGTLALLYEPSWLAAGLPYSLTLLVILLAHEMGHYLTCRHYGIAASLPYFLPAPTLIGTFGAFIRIRSAIFSKRQLFDVGVAGPLAGFVFIVPALAIGLAYSKVIPGIGAQGDVVYGTPLILRAMEWVLFPGVPVADIYLHPVARAAWVGLFATALNLLPIGQLDGGHIVYALAGSSHKLLTHLSLGVLLLLGFYWPSWVVWAVVLFLLARRHPRIYDQTPLGSGRTKLGALALAILMVSFNVTPLWIRS